MLTQAKAQTPILSSRCWEGWLIGTQAQVTVRGDPCVLGEKREPRKSVLSSDNQATDLCQYPQVFRGEAGLPTGGGHSGDQARPLGTGSGSVRWDFSVMKAHRRVKNQQLSLEPPPDTHTPHTYTYICTQLKHTYLP